MIALRADLKVVLAAQPVDFRKSVHTLSALVSEALQREPVLRRRLRVPQQAHGQSEASGVGRQRHGAGDEVAAAGTLHLAADPRRSGASERNAARDAARRARVDAGLAKACEAAGSCRVRGDGFRWSM